MGSLIKLSKLFMLFIALNLSIDAQNSIDLQTILNSPMKEFYQINENVWLDVKYGQDKQLCSVAVTEKYSFTDKPPVVSFTTESQKSEKSSNDIYLEVVKNLTSSIKFGKLIKNTGTNVGNCFTSIETQYENVNVSSIDRVCGFDAPRQSYVIKWKQKECKDTRK